MTIETINSILNIVTVALIVLDFQIRLG